MLTPMHIPKYLTEDPPPDSAHDSRCRSCKPPTLVAGPTHPWSPSDSIRFQRLGAEHNGQKSTRPTEGAGTETVGKVKRLPSLTICLTSCATALYSTIVCSLSLHCIHIRLSKSSYTLVLCCADSTRYISSNKSNPLCCCRAGVSISNI